MKSSLWMTGHEGLAVERALGKGFLGYILERRHKMSAGVRFELQKVLASPVKVEVDCPSFGANEMLEGVIPGVLVAAIEWIQRQARQGGQPVKLLLQSGGALSTVSDRGPVFRGNTLSFYTSLPVLTGEESPREKEARVLDAVNGFTTKISTVIEGLRVGSQTPHQGEEGRATFPFVRVAYAGRSWLLERTMEEPYRMVPLDLFGVPQGRHSSFVLALVNDSGRTLIGPNEGELRELMESHGVDFEGQLTLATVQQSLWSGLGLRELGRFPGQCISGELRLRDSLSSIL